MKVFWKRAGMLIVLMFLFPFSACNKGKTNNAEVLDTPISSKELDLAVASWYLDQFEAINILAKILEVHIEYGSKIENSPDDLFNIQESAILKSENGGFYRNLTPWDERQKMILEKLEQNLMIKRKMLVVTDGEQSRQGLTCLKAQTRLIDQSIGSHPK
jgi:hypothetical protein